MPSYIHHLGPAAFPIVQAEGNLADLLSLAHILPTSQTFFLGVGQAGFPGGAEIPLLIPDSHH